MISPGHFWIRLIVWGDIDCGSGGGARCLFEYVAVATLIEEALDDLDKIVARRGVFGIDFEGDHAIGDEAFGDVIDSRYLFEAFSNGDERIAIRHG